MVRYEIVYTGRVQGVGFRARARSVARDFAVSGWVRNEPDGTVLLQVQGEEEEVAGFRQRLTEVLRRNIDSETTTRLAPEANPEAGKGGPGRRGESSFVIRR